MTQMALLCFLWKPLAAFLYSEFSIEVLKMGASWDLGIETCDGLDGRDLIPSRSRTIFSIP
jgi:hypothetical protein